jgi:DNA-binding response OmpR family regulator
MSSELPIPLRILVVDDEQTIASTMAIILRKAGFETKAVFSGAEAVEAAKTFGPDILLTDYLMPGMNGLEAARQISRILPACRIILLTGQHGIEEQVSTWQKQGYDLLLLRKPLPPGDVLKAVHSDKRDTGEGRRRAVVLNVDDDESHRYSITRLLKREGFEVMEASTGAQAVKMTEQLKPDVVLLDVRLPDLDGYDVCQKLKANPETSHVSVVHITAYDDTVEGRILSEQSGADEFLSHPIGPDGLIVRLRSVLQHKYLQ